MEGAFFLYRFQWDLLQNGIDNRTDLLLLVRYLVVLLEEVDDELLDAEQTLQGGVDEGVVVLVVQAHRGRQVVAVCVVVVLDLDQWATLVHLDKQEPNCHVYAYLVRELFR